MNKRIGWLFLCGALLSGSVFGEAAAPEAQRDGRPLAVLMYADWCANCKMLIPRMEEIEPGFSTRIRFERLDVTSPETKAGARDKARDLGISRVYYANKGTGLIALIDRRHDKVGELRPSMSDDDIRAALEALAAGAQIPKPASEFTTPPGKPVKPPVVPTPSAVPAG